MSKFNERAFLIRSIIGVFLFQFLTVGYQTFLCQRSVSSSTDREQVTLVCNNAANSYNETGKLALATILALLVPNSKQDSPQSDPSVKQAKRKPRTEEVSGPENTEG